MLKLTIDYKGAGGEMVIDEVMLKSTNLSLSEYLGNELAPVVQGLINLVDGEGEPLADETELKPDEKTAENIAKSDAARERLVENQRRNLERDRLASESEDDGA